MILQCGLAVKSTVISNSGAQGVCVSEQKAQAVCGAVACFRTCSSEHSRARKQGESKTRRMGWAQPADRSAVAPGGGATAAFSLRSRQRWGRRFGTPTWPASHLRQGLRLTLQGSWCWRGRSSRWTLQDRQYGQCQQQGGVRERSSIKSIVQLAPAARTAGCRQHRHRGRLAWQMWHSLAPSVLEQPGYWVRPLVSSTQGYTVHLQGRIWRKEGGHAVLVRSASSQAMPALPTAHSLLPA